MVFLFGLFLRCTSLMISWPKLVRLVLLVFSFILFYQFYRFYVSLGDNWCCLICFAYHLLACSCMPILTTRFLMHAYDSDLSIHVCLSLHATWHSSYHSLGSFLTPLELDVQISEIGQTWILLLRIKLTLRSRQTSYGSSPLFCLPLFGSWYLLVARDQHLWCSYCKSCFYVSWWCNITVILYHTLW